jgi:hypothetical protein
MIDSPACPSPPPDGRAGTGTRPDGWQAEEVGAAARRWLPWDSWLDWYEETQGW